jgi:hypothetical protein
VRAITNRETLSRSGIVDDRSRPVPDLFCWVGKIHIGNPLHSGSCRLHERHGFLRGLYYKCIIKQKVVRCQALALWLHKFYYLRWRYIE